ncbi:MAG: ABC transporter ATP-binding protein [Bacteroidales bacterium]
MPDYSIIIQNISKSYGQVKALTDVSFQVEHSEIFGLIGPDGAGKTTLFRILTSLLIPDSGVATVEGFDVVKSYKQIRQITGYMPGRFSLYYDLTVEENLNFFATIFGTTIEENYHLIRDIYVQIEPFKKRRAGNLSGGMKQKLALSCALIHKPKVLVLDEPTTGVDAVSRKEFWEMLAKLKEQNITIIVSTPYMDEASLCDHVALIQKGKIMTIDTPAKIIEAYPDPLYKVSGPNMFNLLNQLRNFPKAKSAHRFGDSIHVAMKGDFGQAEIEDFTKEKGHEEIQVKPVNATIEDSFMALMNTNNDK